MSTISMATLNQDQLDYLAALRSGNRLQGQGAMRLGPQGPNAKFCCMGVACDVFGYELKRSTWHEDSYGVDRADTDLYPDGPTGVTHNNMPTAINERLDLTDADNDALAGMNDQWNFTFWEIGEVVEEAWLKGTSVASIYRKLVAIHHFFVDIDSLRIQEEASDAT